MQLDGTQQGAGPTPARNPRRRSLGVGFVAVASVLGTSIVIATPTPALAATATVTGTVFADVDFDGVRDAGELGVAGVAVRAVAADGASVGTATTTSNGTYSMSINTGSQALDLRVEFATPAGSGSSAAGASAVQFIKATEFVGGVRSGIDYGVRATSLDDPANSYYAIPSQHIGQSVNGADLNLFTIASAKADSPPIALIGPNKAGSLFGTASLRDDWVFSSAFMRRNSPFGPGGTGAIYLSDVNQAIAGTPNRATFATIPNAGTSPRTGGTGAETAWAAANYDWIRDFAGFPLVGKISLGDMDMGVNNAALYVTNLNDKRLYRVAIVDNGAAAPTAGAITSVAIPSISGCPAVDSRPFGLESDLRGTIYVAVTCTTGTLAGQVFAYDEATSAFTPVLNVPFVRPGPNPVNEWLCCYNGAKAHIHFLENYPTTTVNPANNNLIWRPWSDDNASIYATYYNGDAARTEMSNDFVAPQPIITDLTLDGNGDLTINVGDRNSYRYGNGAYLYNSSRTGIYTGASDIIKACGTPGAWVMESAGTCGGVTNTTMNPGQTPDPQINNQGIGGGEFYADRPSPGDHCGDDCGGAASEYAPGAGVLISNSGAHRGQLNNGTGAQTFNNLRLAQQGGIFKSHGLGEMSRLINVVPVEIGNRVWIDTDKDGIQDAGEAGVDGVMVRLYNTAGALLATTTTGGGGQYYFDNADGVVPGGQYTIKLDNPSDFTNPSLLAHYLITSTDSSNTSAAAALGGPNSVDNDATDADGAGTAQWPTLVAVAPASGADHTFDFGFFLQPQLTFDKRLVGTGAVPRGGGLFTVSYDLVVTNAATAAVVYSLTDNFRFGAGVTVSGAVVVTRPAGASVPGVAFDGVANNVVTPSASVPGLSSHTYRVVVDVAVNELTASSASLDCTPSSSPPATGAFNEATLTFPGGVVSGSACAPLPAVVMVKDIVDVPTRNANGSFHVRYTVRVSNTGPIATSYSLSDAFDFGVGVTPVAGSAQVAKPGGALVAGWTGVAPATQVVTNEPILVGGVHVYTVDVDVNVAVSTTASALNCAADDGSAGTGGRNVATIVHNGESVSDDACGEFPPSVEFEKNLIGSSAVPIGGGQYRVQYELVVTAGPGGTTYSLTDALSFGAGVTIDSATVARDTSTAAPVPRALWNGQSDVVVVAAGTPIAAGARHRFVVTAVVSIVEPVATRVSLDCLAEAGGGSTGTFNTATMTSPIRAVTDTACAPLPEVAIAKTLTSGPTPAANGDGTYDVTYDVVVSNVGPVATIYDLDDTFQFGAGVSVVAGSVSVTSADTVNESTIFDGAANARIVTGQVLVVAGVHTFTVRAKIRPSSSSTIADLDCAMGAGESGTGTWNNAKLTHNGEFLTDYDCGSINPSITFEKNLVGGPVGNADGTYTVTYELIARNGVGARTYNLNDQFLFGGSVLIVGAPTVTAPAGVVANAGFNGVGNTVVVTNQAIPGLATHRYVIAVVVRVEPAAVPGDLDCPPNDTVGDTGTFNRATLSSAPDSISDTACAPLPKVGVTKVAQAPVVVDADTFDVTYLVTVANQGAVATSYSLSDRFNFGVGVTIVSSSGVGIDGSTAVVPWNTQGPNTLATGAVLPVGVVHVYTVRVRVDVGSAATAVSLDCDGGQVGNGTGTFNTATLRFENRDVDATACQPLPRVVFDKSLTSGPAKRADGTFDVGYTVTVRNVGATNTVYGLTDTFRFGVGMTILGSSANGPGGVVTPWDVDGPVNTLANNLAIVVGGVHTYTVNANVAFNSAVTTSTGLDCTVTNVSEGTGFLNEARLTFLGQTTLDDACAPAFDLALIKTLASGQAATVAPGDKVRFQITVMNQGGVAARNVTVTDFVPSGFSYVSADNPQWSTAGGRPTYVVAGPLVPGGSAVVEIVLTVQRSSLSTGYKNFAEISVATPVDGAGVAQPSWVDIDSTPDTTNGNGAGESTNLKDNVVNESSVTGDEDDHDPAEVKIFDLALVKRLSVGQSSVVRAGDVVSFDVTTTNQGTLAATNVALVDYVPVGMTFSGGDNVDWLVVDGVPTYPLGSLAVGASVTVTIRLRVGSGVNGTLDNYAEVASATGPAGEVVVDFDSVPDSTNGNSLNGFNGERLDATMVDDQVSGDGRNGQDEDDHDIASVTAPIFDLALLKTLAVGQRPVVYPGDVVTFAIDVINQGAQAATSIVVTDYVPVGMMFVNDAVANPGWSLVAGKPTYTIPGPLAPGASSRVLIKLTVNAGVTAVELENVAEISGAVDVTGRSGIDIDSVPDTINGNGPGESNNLEDGQIHERPTVNNGDEDDHDPAKVMIGKFDLALRKTLMSPLSGVVGVGGAVTFTIRVFNQGNVAAVNVPVVDHIPAQLQLDDADWAAVPGGTATTVLPGPIVPNGSAAVDITFRVLSTTPAPIVNHAEITSGALDGDGRTPTDIDSTPDTTNGNDVLIDDEIALTAVTGDEDDHDVAAIKPGEFDLALRKTLAVGQARDVLVGDLVTFNVTVINQGEVNATNVKVHDYIPAGLALADTDWTGVGSDAEMIVAALPAGAEVVLPITFRVVAAGPIRNWTEIASAVPVNEQGAPISVPDIDSIPDTVLGNDGSIGNAADPVIDDQVTGDGKATNPAQDEDDHDFEPLQAGVFDLALIKQVAAGQGNVYAGDVVRFNITVTNQGSVAAHNVDVADYVPAGMMFVQADNPTFTFDLSTGLPFTTITGPIAANGGTAQVPIFLRVVAAGAVLTNWAEIADAELVDGRHPIDVDSTPDIANTDRFVTDDSITGNGKTGGDEDDHDPATVTGQVFDLALRKTLAASQSRVIALGDDVRFDVTVFNQGTVAASNVLVSDFVPVGFAFNTSLNPGWVYDPATRIATTTITGPVAASDTTSTNDQTVVQIVLTVTDATRTLVNLAEITDATDPNGEHPTDKDSTPDNDPINDGPLKDDEINENGKGPEDEDEDDHDKAEVTPYLFDLALTKTLAAGQARNVYVGQTVTFNVNVINQGLVAGSNVVVTDYIPTGLQLADPDWINNGNGTASFTVGAVPVNATAIVVPVTFTVIGTGALVNVAEISVAVPVDAQGNPLAVVDIDSTPDTVNADVYITNDFTGGNGKTGGDEDDHDPESLTSDRFDLALRKLTIGNPNPVYLGDIVTFGITVFNQGTITANNITVTDYVPAGLRLVSRAGDAAWVVGANGTITTVIAGPITPGASQELRVSFEVTSNAAAIVNLSEISRAEDPNGTTPPDIDSTPDTTPNNDGPIKPNEINENAKTGGDEDDHDDETIVPVTFDVALRKTLATTGELSVGDNVTFDIAVFNQGAVNARNITVIDYVPAGLAFVPAASPGWTASGTQITTVIAGPITPGGSATIQVTFQIVNAGPIINLSEITDAKDDNGRTPPDIDSTPDDKPNNDGPPQDDEINQKPPVDEDDHDPATINTVTYSIGNQIWADADNDGRIDTNEIPIAGVTVELYADTNNDGEPDGTTLANTTTDTNGLYLFTGLNPGSYIVAVAASNFAIGGPLFDRVSSDPTTTNPNDGTDNDDNGVISGSMVRSGTILLDNNSPLTEQPDNDPTTADQREDLTIDFGFFGPLSQLPPPTTTTMPPISTIVPPEPEIPVTGTSPWTTIAASITLLTLGALLLTTTRRRRHT